MALVDQWNAAGSAGGGSEAGNEKLTSFQQRVCMAAVGAAIDIANEGADVPNHAKRAALAQAVTNAPWTWMSPFGFCLAARGLDAGSNDQQIIDTVAAVWNAMAGTS